MKAKLLTISAAVMALLAVSCQREETGFGLPAGEEVTVTISASVPSGGPSVKSNADPGNGDQINRCILGVYMVDGENGPQLYGTRVYKQVTGGQATFEDVTLLTGYDYKLVFWADNVASTTNLQTDNHYVTTDFPKVTYNTTDGHQYMSSDDTRDAFYGVFDLNDFSGEVQDSYILTRPFGQLNIFTTDYDDIKMEALKPAKVQMAFTSIPTGLNLLTGETTSGSVTGAVSDIQTITDPVVSGAKQLSFDYVFAPEDQQLIINDIVMSFYDANGSQQLAINAYAFPGLPVRANYRTNVSGALLTKSSNLKISIDEDFESPDIMHDARTITITTTEAGQLASVLEEYQDVKVLKIVGPISSTDLKAIEDLLEKRGGTNEEPVDAPLEVLDLSDATGLTTNVVISPDGSGSVYRNYTLKKITLPEGITSIGRWGFAGFCALEEINIPSTVTSLGHSAFRMCEKLETITIPEGITSIPSNCFWRCGSLRECNIPESVERIESGAFSFTSLEGSLVFGENLEYIGGSAFYRTNISSIDMSKTKITSICEVSGDMNAFADCSNLTSLVLPNTITSIGTTAFSSSPIGIIDLPASVTSLKNNAFDWRGASIVISRAVTPPTISSKIYASSAKTVLQVPEEALSAYQASGNWNCTSFLRVEAIPTE